MAILEFDSEGVAAMENTMKMIQEMGATVAGIQLDADTRDNGITNAELLLIHAEGIESKTGTVVRNVLATPLDVNEMAAAFMDKASEVLEGISDDPAEESEIKRKANQAMAKGLKDGAQIYRKKLMQRVNDGMASDGNPLDPVTPEYAAQRLRKYGVPASAVFKASGDLLNNLARGRFRFTKKK